MKRLTLWSRIFLIFAVIEVEAPYVFAQASDILTLNAHLYDHDYGYLAGGKNPAGLPTCTYDFYRVLPGLAQDTLHYNPRLGKKIPQSKNSSCFPGQIENWFDPTNAQVNTCGNIFLRNIGSADKPIWKIQDDQFFPVDSISKQKHWVQSNGTVLENDFEFCMEINTSVHYSGGEYLKFNGDDDLWVYLDNRLAVDQGGIHFALPTVTYLDSLPFLVGKQGKNIDMDIYFCSRVPKTSVFGMETNLELKPLTVKSIKIVDTAGNNLKSEDILVGRSRLCARANFQLSTQEVCGNY